MKERRKAIFEKYVIDFNIARAKALEVRIHFNFVYPVRLHNEESAPSFIHSGD